MPCQICFHRAHATCSLAAGSLHFSCISSKKWLLVDGSRGEEDRSNPTSPLLRITLMLFSRAPFRVNFGATVTSNGLPYATGLLSCLSCLSVTLMYCGPTVGWIKMPLGTEVGLSPGDVVLDRDPAPSTERGTAVPHFWAHFALARSPISATAELLFNFSAAACPRTSLAVDSWQRLQRSRACNSGPGAYLRQPVLSIRPRGRSKWTFRLSYARASRGNCVHDLSRRPLPVAAYHE